jgi:fibronectin type 3 domain-containing protein
VYRGTSAGSLSLLQSGVSTNAYLDTTISNGTTYFYAVTAFNGAESNQSNVVSIKPIATVNLTAVTAASSTSLNITWSSADGADAYDVRYGTASGVYLATVSSVTSSYTLTGLSASTTYFISVRARNSIGSGLNVDSNEMNATTATPGPSGLAATAVAGQVNLTWPAVSGSTSYNVYRGISSGTYSQIASGVSALTYADSTVSNGTTYYYMIRAFNGIESSNSNEVVILPMASFSISALTALSSTTAQVSWTGPTGATAYDVLYGTATETYATTVTNITSPYTMTGLTAGGTFYVVVRARNTVGAGTNLLSTEGSVTTSTAAPATLAAAATPGQVTLNWATTPGAASYRVYRGTTTGVYSLLASNITTTTYADATVVNGTTYFYVVRAFNGTESMNSTEASSRPISNFSISSVSPLSTTSLQVTWAAVSGASTYNVRYGTNTGVYSTTVSNVTSPYTITGLSANTNYFIQVQAQNTIGSGASVNSTESSQITPLTAPSGLTANGGASQVNLTWTAVSGATSYKVLRGTVSGTHTLLVSGVSGTTYSDTSAVAGTPYFYVVRAFNGNDSANSNEVTAQPIAAFTISSVTGTNSTTLSVSWSAPAGANSYDLSYGTTSGTYTTTLTNVTSPSTITGLSAATTYFVRVTAKNATGSGTTVHSTQSSGTTNSVPVLSLIADQTMEVGTSLPVSFSLTDNNDLLSCSGSISASSSNTTLVPNANIVFSGTLPNCIATITPATGQQGTTTISLIASDGKDSANRSFALEVTGCTVASIIWETQPTSVSAGTTWTSAPRVSLRKADNSLCTTNLDAVTIDVFDDNSVQQDASILGTNSVIPSGGYATFAGAFMTRAGSNFTLIASQGGIESAESSFFNITALSPSRIVFSQQPETTDMLVTMVPSPVVRVADTHGNFVTGSSNTVTLTLMDNSEGATLAGTLSRTATGTFTYSGLSINRQGNYFIRASSNLYGTVDSNFFDIRILIPQTVATTLDMLLGPITLATSTSKTSFNRSIIPMGSSFIDGSTTYTWSIVAQNTNSSTNSSIRLRIGTTNIASITVPANTLTPTRYNVSVSNASVTASGNWTLRAENGMPTVFSSKISVRQTNANKTLILIPLTSINETAGFTISNTTMGAPNQQRFVPYNFIRSKFSKIDSAILHISGRKVAGNLCGQLWNKTTNTAITTTETCITNTSETTASATVNVPSLPATGELEFRARCTTGTAVVFKAALILRIVGIEDLVAIQKVAGMSSNISSSSNLVEFRTVSSTGDFGTAFVNQYLRCQGRAAAAGSATLSLRDHALNNTGTTGSTAITASNISFTNQLTFTSVEAGPLATTNGNNLFMNINWTSGTFETSHCLLETEAVY